MVEISVQNSNYLGVCVVFIECDGRVNAEAGREWRFEEILRNGQFNLNGTFNLFIQTLSLSTLIPLLVCLW
jgi:hypothetical protein